MPLSVRTKRTRQGELHLICPGDGCDARIGKLFLLGQSPVVFLEPRYTNEPSEQYPQGCWWRRKRGGYDDMPRYRDIRRGRVSFEDLRYYTGPTPDRALNAYSAALARFNFGVKNPKRGKPKPRRTTYGPSLREGMLHHISCYQCNAVVVVDVSAVAKYQ